MIVRELLTKLGFAVDNAQLNKYERGVTNIKSRADEAANSFRNMFAAFLGFQGLKSLVNVADEFQNIRARMALLPQTVGDVAQSFDMVAARAMNARQSIEVYSSFYIKAGEATKKFIKTQDELLNIVDGAAFGLAASGANAVSQSQAFFQLGQAIASPIVQMSEMNTLIDAAPQLFAALGDAIVGEGKNFKDIIGKGEITGKQLAEGLSVVAPYFEARMKTIPNTIEQAMLRISNKYKLFVDKLNRESMIITKAANFINDSFDKVESAINDLVKLLGGASNTIRIFGIIAAVALAPFIASLILGAVMALPMIAAVVLIGLAIDDVITYLRGGESMIGKFFNAFKEGVTNKGSPAIVLLAALLSYVTLLLSMAAIGAAVNYAKMTISALAHYQSTRIAALYSYAMQGAGFVNMVAKMLWGYGVIAAKAMWMGLRMAAAWLIGLGPIGLIIAAIALLAGLATYYWDDISKGFLGMIDKMKGYWNDFKSFFGVGVSTNITAGKVAGAASSAGGVSGAGNQTNANVTINQELPPGTSKETADAAKSATKMAIGGSDFGFLTGGMGAYAQ